MPMKNPKVSVILPTFNRAAYLPDAIESVLCQTFRDFELVIVDDGSTDNTRQIVQMYPDKRIRYRFKQNGGIASALNCGIKQSTGTYLARLDSDDVFLPEKLAYQVACLDANPDCGLVYTQAYNMDEKGNVLDLYLKDHISPREPLLVLRKILFPPSQSIMFRRSCIDQIGYFNENLDIAEDWDFCIRMAQHFMFAYCGEPLVKIRKHAAMITSDKIKTARNILKVMKRYEEILSFGAGRSWLGVHHYHLGRLYLNEGALVQAKKQFLTAFRYQPFLLKHLFFFGVASLPKAVFERLRGLKKWIWIGA